MTPTGMWVFPFPGVARVNSWFGFRISPGGIGSSDHVGVDFATPSRSPILSVSDGVVLSIGLINFQGSGYGYHVRISHPDGSITRYAHFLEPPTLREGDPVVAGQEVGKSGNTGTSVGTHLHFDVVVDGKPVDPVSFMLERGVDFTALPFYEPIGPWK